MPSVDTKDSKYVISRLVINNIVPQDIDAFLDSFGLLRKFKESKKSHEDFLSDCLDNEEISLLELDEFLYSALQYGKNKCVYISELADCSHIDKNYIMSRVSTLYHAKSEFANIATNNLLNSKDRLAALKCIMDSNGKLVEISLILGEQIKVTKEGALLTKFAYVPVSINLMTRQIILKTNPNIDGTKEKKYTYNGLAIDCLEKVKLLLQVNLVATNITNFQKMHSVAKNLTHKYFATIAEEQGGDLEGVVQTVSQYIIENINIDDIEQKRIGSDIFDIRSNVKFLIENVKLFDFIASNTDPRPILAKLDGFLTYIKYEDRNAYLIRFRGANYTKDISKSETFLRLRGDLEKFKEISTIQVFWFKQHGEYANKFRVRYEVFTPEILQLYFYYDFNEDDFHYAIDQFKQFGNGDIE